MNEEEEKGKQKEGRRRDKHEQSTRAWSMRILNHTGRIQELTARQNVQRRLGRLLGPGFEYHFKDLGASELPKDFRTGNDMIRCEM